MQLLIAFGAIAFGTGVFVGLYFGRRAGYRRAVNEGAREAARRYAEEQIPPLAAGTAEHAGATTDA